MAKKKRKRAKGKKRGVPARRKRRRRPTPAEVGTKKRKVGRKLAKRFRDEADLSLVSKYDRPITKRSGQVVIASREEWKFENGIRLRAGYDDDEFLQFFWSQIYPPWEDFFVRESARGGTKAYIFRIMTRHNITGHRINNAITTLRRRELRHLKDFREYVDEFLFTGESGDRRGGFFKRMTDYLKDKTVRSIFVRGVSMEAVRPKKIEGKKRAGNSKKVKGSKRQKKKTVRSRRS